MRKIPCSCQRRRKEKEAGGEETHLTAQLGYRLLY